MLTKGRQEGIMIGEQKGKLEVAMAMLARGMDRDTVMQLTGLTPGELASIRH